MAIGIIVVGVGARGQDWVREIRKNENYELTACVDISPDTLQRAAETLNVPPQRCFTQLTEALQKTEAAAVVIATPPDCHVQTCETALSHGLAVLVEKPFALNLTDAAKLVSLAAQQNTPLLVAQNYRYMRAFRTARKLISEGMLGPVGLAVCQYYRIPHELAPSLSALPHSILWGIGVHHLDMLRHVLAKEVVGVLAESFSLSWDQPDGGSLRLLLTLEDGSRVVYTATYQSSGHDFFERGQEFYARFVGPRATLHIFQRWLILCETAKLPRLIRRGRRKVTEEQILLNQLERALIAGEEPDTSGRDNLQTMAIVEACLRSTTEQRWVNPQELMNELEQ